jgi:hypothetical protein
MLTDKEVEGLVIKDGESDLIPKPNWVLVGKACTPHKLIN